MAMILRLDIGNLPGALALADDGTDQMGILGMTGGFASRIIAVGATALVLAACQGSRLGSLDTRQPAPLTPAPSGTVTAQQLPPPTQPGTTDPDDFPAAPEGEEQVAALDPAAAEANAPEITAGGVAGVWNASVAGQSCRVATPQTKFGQGYRAGPLRCPAPLDGVKSWNVNGKQLALYDDGGNVLARLYSSGPEKFDGQTASGQPISLSR